MEFIRQFAGNVELRPTESEGNNLIIKAVEESIKNIHQFNMDYGEGRPQSSLNFSIATECKLSTMFTVKKS